MNSAILNILAQAPNQLEMSTLVEDSRWQAVVARDGASDGKFVFAVSSTGVYCRPSCPSRSHSASTARSRRAPQAHEG